MKKILSKIFVMAVFMAVYFAIKPVPQEELGFKEDDILRAVKEVIPGAVRIDDKNYVSGWSVVYGSDELEAGRFLLTSPYCDDITGYAGPLKAVLISGTDGKILGVKLLSHRETPSWISGLERIKFFDSWNGKSVTELADHTVDAVSGATYTSRAVDKIIRKRAEIFTGRSEYVTSGRKTEISVLRSPIDVVLYVILSISLLGIFIKKINKYRILIQLSSVIFFGIISGRFVSIYLLESISVNGIKLFTSWTTILLLAFSILIPFIFNRHYYCYYICPFGGAQTILGKLPVKKIVPGAGTIRFFRLLRLLVFVSLTVLILLNVKINLTLVEPFTVFMFFSASAITITGSAVIFIASVFIKNPWCIYLCPTGQFFDLLKDGV